LANLTTLDEDCVDDACILEPSDFVPFLTQATTVAYSRAKTGALARLQELVDYGQFHPIRPIPTATLAKILQGGHKSRELSACQKQLIAPVP
jgi:hypothetical protein